MQQTGEGSMCSQTFSSSSRKNLEQFIEFPFPIVLCLEFEAKYIPYKQTQQNPSPPSYFFLIKDEGLQPITNNNCLIGISSQI